ncbi:MAG: hypothetical protein U9N49_04615 [Campylobacterota bacterium]|nr:hypothetical protein [Campylobacterota bacterium]
MITLEEYEEIDKLINDDELIVDEQFDEWAKYRKAHNVSDHNDNLANSILKDLEDD